MSFLFMSCRYGDERHRYALQEGTDTTPVRIHRLDKDIASFINDDRQHRDSIINADLELLKGYALIVNGTDSVDERLMSFWSTWPATTMFMPEVDRLYSDLEPEEHALGLILETAKANSLAIPADKFASVTWGDSHSIIINEGNRTAYLALNHYLGALNEAYNGWPRYKTKLKTRDMIPVDMAEALLATSYPYIETDEATVLNRLIYEGSIATAKHALVPAAPLNLILGFTADEMQQVVDNEEFIGKQLLKDNKLYSSDQTIISNLFDLRPSSTLISPDAPGRASRYIGYKIVQSYLDNNAGTTLSELLSPSFYNDGISVLRKSGYLLGKSE